MNNSKPNTVVSAFIEFNDSISKIWIRKKVQTGQFGADMKVSLLNDGPVTIIIDTKNKE